MFLATAQQAGSSLILRPTSEDVGGASSGSRIVLQFLATKANPVLARFGAVLQCNGLAGTSLNGYFFQATSSGGTGITAGPIISGVTANPTSGANSASYSGIVNTDSYQLDAWVYQNSVGPAFLQATFTISPRRRFSRQRHWPTTAHRGSRPPGNRASHVGSRLTEPLAPVFIRALSLTQALLLLVAGVLPFRPFHRDTSQSVYVHAGAERSHDSIYGGNSRKHCWGRYLQPYDGYDPKRLHHASYLHGDAEYDYRLPHHKHNEQSITYKPQHGCFLSRFILNVAPSPTSAAGSTINQTVTITGIGTSFTGSPFSISGGFRSNLQSQAVTEFDFGIYHLQSGRLRQRQHHCDGHGEQFNCDANCDGAGEWLGQCRLYRG